MTTANYIVAGITALVAFGMPIMMLTFSILISRDEKTAKKH
jgi:NADH:ubiquinone oxidoreductase subunit 3 (subunit A)